MPFKSEKQRRFLWAEHPEIAKRWAHKYPESNKGLPMYADKKKDADAPVEKNAVLAALDGVLSGITRRGSLINDVAPKTRPEKKANSGMVYIDIPHSDKPTYAGEEREEGEQKLKETDSSCVGEKSKNDPVDAVFGKLAVVLAPQLRKILEEQQALTEARDPLYVPENIGVRRYAVPSPVVAPPIGMQPPAPQPTMQQPANAPQAGPVGGGSNPQFNPINAFGALGSKGQINGNAAFGQKNSPDSAKTAGQSSSLQWLTSMDFSGLPDPNDLDLDFDEDARSKSAAGLPPMVGRMLAQGAGLVSKAAPLARTVVSPVTNTFKPGYRQVRQALRNTARAYTDVPTRGTAPKFTVNAPGTPGWVAANREMAASLQAGGAAPPSNLMTKARIGRASMFGPRAAETMQQSGSLGAYFPEKNLAVASGTPATARRTMRHELAHAMQQRTKNKFTLPGIAGALERGAAPDSLRWAAGRFLQEVHSHAAESRGVLPQIYSGLKFVASPSARNAYQNYYSATNPYYRTLHGLATNGTHVLGAGAGGAAALGGLNAVLPTGQPSPQPSLQPSPPRR